jgi:para-nitrobenzyl esterase
MDEDCLTLNVWTPAADGARRPVVVWLHGGAFSVGHAGSHMSDGENLARNHDVVFVSVTHRLNVFGYLDLSRWAGDEYADSGVAGMLDLILALEWIRDEIAGFGGDPDNVTIVGESGGGAKVSTLMAMPAARGLFHRAVCQSGVATVAATPDESEALARDVADRLGGGLDALLTAPAGRLVEALASVPAGDRWFMPRPVLDGVHLPDVPPQSWSASPVPVIVGTCRDETTGFGVVDLDIEVELPAGFAHGVGIGDRPMFGAQTRDDVAAILRCDPDSAIDAWLASHPGGTREQAHVAVLGAGVFEIASVGLAEEREAHGSAAFVYRLDWASPRMGALGSPHSTSVSLFFDNADRVPFAQGLPAAHTVSSEMSRALVAFARTGSPDLDGLPWPRYEAASRSVRMFDVPSRLETDPGGDVRRALQAESPTALL